MRSISISISSSLPLFLFMWSFLWSHVYGQSSAVRPSANATTTATRPTATLAWAAIPTLTACKTARLQWTATGSGISSYNISVYVIGTTGDQSTSSSSNSSSSVQATASTRASSTVTSTVSNRTTTLTSRDLGKRAGEAINKGITVQAASSSTYNYLVDLPYGRYYLHGKLSDSSGTSANSPLFWVIEGDDTSCLTGGSTLSSSSAASASITASSTSNAAGAAGTSAGSGVATESKSGLSGGAIAGVAIGTIAGIAAIVAIWFFCFHRRKRDHEGDGQPSMRSRGMAAFGDRFPGGGPVIGSPRDVRKNEIDLGRSHGGHIALASIGGSHEGQEKDEGPFVGSYESEPSTPVYLAQLNSANSPGNTPPNSAKRDPFATNPNTPMVESSGFDTVLDGTTDRRNSQPPFNTAVIDETPDRTRSDSVPSIPTGHVVGVKRNVSARRKPVPPLGAELRDQMRNEGSRKPSELKEDMSKKEILRASYSIMPDPPKGTD